MPVAAEKSVRWVVFDAVGTLMFAEPSVAEVYARIGSHYGVQLTLEDVQTRFRSAFNNHELIHQTSEKHELDFWRDVVGEVLGPVSDFERCFGDLYEHFADASSWRIDNSAREIVTMLREHNVDVAIGSNFDSRLHRILDADPVFSEIDARFISSEIGWRKPNAQFFQAIVDQCSVPPHEILMVGDDYENDYVGAIAAGLRAAHLTERVNSEEVVTIPNLHRVLDLCGIER